MPPSASRFATTPGRLHRRTSARSRTVLAAVAALALLLTACGVGAEVPQPAGVSDEGAPATSPAAARPTAPAAPTLSPTLTPEPPPTEPVASTASIPLAELPRVEFVRPDGSAVALAVEVPPRSDYGVGLSGRYELTERGMLFHYPQGTSAIGFYMKNTHIDLAIAFIDLDDRVIAIREMEAESLELVRPGGVYRYAIEAPAGWYAERGVEEGALLRLPPGIALPD